MYGCIDNNRTNIFRRKKHIKIVSEIYFRNAIKNRSENTLKNELENSI